MMDSEIATNIKVKGLNIGGKVGPSIDIAHVIKQNVAAVASAPCIVYIMNVVQSL